MGSYFSKNTNPPSNNPPPNNPPPNNPPTNNPPTNNPPPNNPPTNNPPTNNSKVNGFYWPKNNTLKIFLNPKQKNTCNLGVVNYKRMMKAEKEHHALFDKNIGKGKDENYDTNVITKLLTNKTELFDFVYSGEDIKTKITFTYCYKADGRLYLCKTEGVQDDQKCKHAWLCNKLAKICSAGIIMFSKENHTVYIDNASGTYKTKETNLDIITRDLKNTFGDLNVELLLPNKNIDEKKKYCEVMNKDSVDYLKLCQNKPSTPIGGNKQSKHKRKSKKQKSKKNKSKKQKSKK
jgi:hypothetical protein